MRHLSTAPFPGSFPARLALASGLTACLLGASCVSSRGRAKAIDDFILRAQFADAVQAAADWREDDPDSGEAEFAHRRASVALLLDQARQATFEDNDEFALEVVRDALELAPNNPVVLDWMAKVNRKIADHWLDQAYDLEGNGALEAALEAYENVLSHVPDDEAGLLGVARVLELRQARVLKGQEYYQDGVRQMRDALLEQARLKFAYTTKYLPDDDRAKSRTTRVRQQLSGERTGVARFYEKEKLFPAAYTEYRVALLLDPANKEALEGLERAERESRAIKRLEAADMLVRKGRLEEAQSELDAGAEFTTQQAEDFARMRIDIEENALKVMYGKAYDLESDFRYEQAIAAYDELLAVADYYEDALARRDTLVEYVELASELYQRAEEAETEEEEGELLLQIDLFYPEYRDVPARLERLGITPDH